MKAREEEATLLEKAEKVSFAARLRDEEAEGQALLDYTSEKYQLVESFHENMSQIEFNKFSAMIKAIGAETLQSIALSRPELQVSLLQGLGLNSTLIMDGANPLNLFNTAQKMIAKADTGASAPARQPQQQITGAAAGLGVKAKSLVSSKAKSGKAKSMFDDSKEEELSAIINDDDEEDEDDADSAGDDYDDDY